jgi:hypothetical protein
MRSEWTLATCLIVVGLGTIPANAEKSAAHLSCTSAAQVLSFDLVGYDLDLKKSATTGTGLRSGSGKGYAAAVHCGRQARQKLPCALQRLFYGNGVF